MCACEPAQGGISAWKQSRSSWQLCMRRSYAASWSRSSCQERRTATTGGTRSAIGGGRHAGSLHVAHLASATGLFRAAPPQHRRVNLAPVCSKPLSCHGRLDACRGCLGRGGQQVGSKGCEAGHHGVSGSDADSAPGPLVVPAPAPAAAPAHWPGPEPGSGCGLPPQQVADFLVGDRQVGFMDPRTCGLSRILHGKLRVGASLCHTVTCTRAVGSVRLPTCLLQLICKSLYGAGQAHSNLCDMPVGSCGCGRGIRHMGCSDGGSSAPTQRRPLPGR